MVRRILRESGIDAEVEEIEVTTPDDVTRLRFLGSPTVQVDGSDIEPASRARTDYAMSCRVYHTDSGLPPRSMLAAALGVSESADHEDDDGHRGRSRDCCSPSSDSSADPSDDPADRVGRWATCGSIVTAILSSACCWVPLLLLAFGASAAGVSAVFERWRPLFITLAVGMLALAFYFAYLRKPTCADACCTVKSRRTRRTRRVVFWMTAVFVAAFVLFPQYVGAFLGGSAVMNGAASVYTFDIDGMHCEACAVTLAAELSKIATVSAVQVDYARKAAFVQTDDESSISAVLSATERVGYTASLSTGGSPGNDNN